ncbi:RagB/SusD family nutrient uptake outer membrane protein [Spirosoma pollinicola]|uniref:RagB/SusD family nutrient uptake outer membrane protein n=1 Tax=Spirosoma pollinicola TaxID=2057025 RepID=A0A2K8YT81_9BACT|nr:RagB/SusD family nutrient uptake outer membrane protein [Spirosoma pollinicola]AUD00831.1 RagB/SusD family nutrient uptake outer membrane protein [Spirosoma pollinicola]
MKTIYKKRLTIGFVSLLLVVVGVASKDSFLNQPPTGTLSSDEITSNAGIQSTLIGAYAELNGRDYGWFGSSFNWLWGSVTGGDANKGSNAGDQSTAVFIQNFTVIPSAGPINDKFRAMYEGISRANTVLRVLKSPGSDVTPTIATNTGAQARFLRGHYYFELKRTFNNTPYVDETLDYSNGVTKVTNQADLWPKIEADFKYAYENLPETQDANGRANKWAAASYLAKTYLYQKKYTEARSLFDLIIASGKTPGGQKYALVDNFTTLFNAANSINPEAIFAIQNAVNTGSVNNANPDMVLNFPFSGGPGSCCGFFQPSFEMANSFRTNANGLPLLDGSYNIGANQIKTDQGLSSADPFTPDAGPLDPRIDYSVGRRGIPYLDWGPHPGANWIRDQVYGGPFAPKKFIYPKSQEGTLTDGTGWTPGYTAINYNIIRYADVLLMAAEAEVEAGSLEKARGYVNQIRARAANPAVFVKGTDGKPVANYVIGQYTTPWTNQASARDAVRFERKLELSGEGHRFFDLVRWGVAEKAVNAFLAYESSKLPGTYAGARFTANKNEYMPIPQQQIDLQGTAVLKQNTGY